MNDDVKNLMVGMTDRQLLEAVEVEFGKYTSEALRIGMEELKHRGISFSDKAVQQYLLHPNTEVNDDDEKEGSGANFSCPNCRIQMKTGRLYMSGTTLGFLVAGISYKNLYFAEKNSTGAERKVLGNSESKVAHSCDSCGFCLF